MISLEQFDKEDKIKKSISLAMAFILGLGMLFPSSSFAMAKEQNSLILSEEKNLETAVVEDIDGSIINFTTSSGYVSVTVSVRVSDEAL